MCRRAIATMRDRLSIPPPHREGRFGFFSRRDLDDLPLPATDREQIWPLFWRHRGGFFAASCRCHPRESNIWMLEESVVPTMLPQSNG
jgi:8-oxo-dGTP diphosphatase